MSTLRRFRHSADGATAIEYGLIASLIAMAIFGALTATGISVEDQWAGLSTAVVNALGGH